MLVNQCIVCLVNPTAFCKHCKRTWCRECHEARPTDDICPISGGYDHWKDQHWSVNILERNDYK